MADIESRIDDVYSGSLREFVAARQALAKSLTGEDRKRVAGLQKPLAVAWIVNQTYWRARRTYEELLEAGRKLRAAQVGALKGRSTDIRGAAERHSEALTKAVAEANTFAQAEGLNASDDALRRMLEAVSTRESLPAPHGRFVKPIEPAGFEALAGIAIAPSRGTEKEPTSGSDERDGHARKESKATAATERRREEHERRREEERAEAARQRKAEIRDAEKRAARALEVEKRARAAWEEARRDVAEADRALADLLASDD